MSDDRPSIAELQKIAHQVRFSGLSDSARIGAAVLVDVSPVLLEIVAAALAWRDQMSPSEYDHAIGKKREILDALAKVRR